MTLVAWAADGFPVYAKWGHAKAGDSASPIRELKPSYRLKKKSRPNPPEGPGGKPDGSFAQDFEYVAGSGDLDECNGRFGVTPEFPAGTYHYVLTEDFPRIPRAFRGEPDESFYAKGGNDPRGLHRYRAWRDGFPGAHEAPR